MNKAVKKAEYRAEQVKTLAEQRGELLTELDGIIGKSKAEVRALTEEETKRIGEIETEVKKISGTLDAERRAEALKAEINKNNAKASKPEKGSDKSGQEDTVKAAEERAVMNYIYRSCGMPQTEQRAGEQNIDMGNNGAIIPSTIANRVIDKVTEMCPILSGAERYSVKGTLKVPVYGKANSTHDITVGYQEEFNELTADAGKLSSVDLTGYLAGALTLIGKSVINNSEISVLNFIISKMTKEISLFIEREMLIGTKGKASGALDTSTTLTAASATAVTADELIELQAKIPQPHQKYACWTMNPETFTSIKKLKDATGQYLLMQNLSNVSNGFPYMLLGKPVYVSDNMPKMAAGVKSILYGDYSGLGVNFRQQIEMQVLNEKYATQHAIGIVAWFEFDSKIIDNQKLAVLVQKAGA